MKLPIVFFVASSCGLVLAGGCAKRQEIEPVPTPLPPSELEVGIPNPTPVPPLPTPVPTRATNSYIVQTGDNLWDVSAEPSVLGDYFRWPLLFRANRDQIIDPDLIEPGQDLTWKSDYSLVEIQDAVQKAGETPPYVPHRKPRKQLPLKY